MWQPLLKLLEFLSRVGVSFGSQETKFSVGNPNAIDSRLDMGWKRFVSSRLLWNAWSPMPGSPWEPYHCVTLFAAIDELARDCKDCKIGPLPDSDLPDYLKPAAGPPPWADRNTLVLLDLPGPRSVSVGYLLAATAGCQTVCTFDNWPHYSGVLQPQRIIGRMLYYAAAMAQLRREKLAPDAPPVWLCDADRLSGRKPPPGGFDNRYLIEDRLLPGPQILRTAGIRRLIYVDETAGSSYVGKEDLRQYLDFISTQGVQVSTVSIAAPESWQKPENYLRRLITDSSWSPSMLGLMRSSAGGFGGFVPQPSSGG